MNYHSEIIEPTTDSDNSHQTPNPEIENVWELVQSACESQHILAQAGELELLRQLQKFVNYVVITNQMKNAFSDTRRVTEVAKKLQITRVGVYTRFRMLGLQIDDFHHKADLDTIINKSDVIKALARKVNLCSLASTEQSNGVTNGAQGN